MRAAVELQECFRLGLPLDAIGSQFHKQLARMLAPAWSFAVAQDMHWPGTVSRPSVRIAERWLAEVVAIAPEHRQVYRALLRVTQMMDSKATLFRPSVAVPVIGSYLRRSLGVPRLEAAAPRLSPRARRRSVSEDRPGEKCETAALR